MEPGTTEPIGGEPSKSYTIQNAHKPRAAVFTLQCKV